MASRAATASSWRATSASWRDVAHSPFAFNQTEIPSVRRLAVRTLSAMSAPCKFLSHGHLADQRLGMVEIGACDRVADDHHHGTCQLIAEFEVRQILQRAVHQAALAAAGVFNDG